MISVYDITFNYFILPISIFGLCLISLIIYLATRHQTHSIIRYIGFLASGSLITTIAICISIIILVWQFNHFSYFYLILRNFPIFLIGILFLFQGMFYFKCERKKKTPTKEDINFYGIMWIIISIINHFSVMFFLEITIYPGIPYSALFFTFFYTLLSLDNYVTVLIILGIYMIVNKGN